MNKEEIVFEKKLQYERSGEVKSNDKLVSFLYELARDHLTCGKLELIVRSSEQTEETFFTNGWLAEYVKDLAARLR